MIVCDQIKTFGKSHDPPPSTITNHPPYAPFVWIAQTCTICVEFVIVLHGRVSFDIDKLVGIPMIHFDSNVHVFNSFPINKLEGSLFFFLSKTFLFLLLHIPQRLKMRIVCQLRMWSYFTFFRLDQVLCKLLGIRLSMVTCEVCFL